jgi:Outer membrane protein beta-barrel domain
MTSVLARYSGLIVLSVALGLPTSARAQASPTATRVADIQIGANFTTAKPDYTSGTWYGGGIYGNIDFRHHLGLELDFHQIPGPGPVLYERTYEAGVRYGHPIGPRFVPYAKVLFGRGVFNFAGPDPATGNTVQVANLAFNTQSIGGGVDFKLVRSINLRLVDYEYQHWDAFPPNGLNPNVLSFGVAYHFH